jgi:hypothetical protein
MGNETPPEQPTRRYVLSQRHYETLAKWCKEVALLILASLVVQKIFLGDVADPVLYLSAVVSLILYYTAFRILIKS